MKIIAKEPLLYSVLKPDTSSLSPSAKSNGVRFSSAKTEINQIINVNQKIEKGINFCEINTLLKFSEEHKKRLLIKMKINETS